jgi:hypothetical protein
MLTFYHGSGSLGYRVEQTGLDPKSWTETRSAALKVLLSRKKDRAAELLKLEGWDVREGGNDWQDEFRVLYRTVRLEDYDVYEAMSRSPDDHAAFADIAKVLIELGLSIRFIGAELIIDTSPDPVSTPKIENSSAAVERALIEAERWVTERSPISAVDRAHTALHGFLRTVCATGGLTASGEESLTELLKWLREHHPKFSGRVPHHEHSGKLLKAMGSICDTLNTLRNRGSLAHANAMLLDDADAMLAINASRTVLHYIHHRLET